MDVQDDDLLLDPDTADGETADGEGQTSWVIASLVIFVLFMTWEI